MLEQITTAEELAALPRGIVVRSSAGTIACRFDQKRGVVFGSDYPFPWDSLQLPLTVLFRPDQPTEPVRVLPSREEVRAAIVFAWRDGGLNGPWVWAATDAVQELYASQRTEAEVKAEAWDEGLTHALIGTASPRALFIAKTANPHRTAQPTHRMIPGSHEQASGPECLCGEAWSLAAGMCAAEVPNVGGEDRG